MCENDSQFLFRERMCASLQGKINLINTRLRFCNVIYDICPRFDQNNKNSILKSTSVTFLFLFFFNETCTYITSSSKTVYASFRAYTAVFAVVTVIPFVAWYSGVIIDTIEGQSICQSGFRFARFL